MKIKPILRKTLTVSLPPAEVVAQVLVCGVEDDAAVERWGVLQLLGAEEPRPVHDERRRKQTDHVCHDLTETNSGD